MWKTLIIGKGGKFVSAFFLLSVGPRRSFFSSITSCRVAKKIALVDKSKVVLKNPHALKFSDFSFTGNPASI